MVDGYSSSKLGAVPTPPQIISYIVHNLLEYLEINRENAQDIEILNVLDPAVGDGRFLIDFAISFKEWANNKKWNEKLQCYGLDINPISIDLANHKIENKKDLKFTDISIKVGNTLLGFIIPPIGWENSWKMNELNYSYVTNQNLRAIDIKNVRFPFHWFFEWPETVVNEGFDVVLGNPPYGIKFSNEEKKLLRKIYKAYDPELESYILFIERSVQLLREGGLLGMIVPSNLLSNYRYRNIRQFLLENVKILKITNLDKLIFPKFHVEACILFLQKINPQKNQEINKIQFEKIKSSSNHYLKPYERQIIIQEEIHTNPNKLLLPKPDISIRLILEKIQESSIPLHKIVSISRGIELGFHSLNTSDRKLDADCVPLIAGRSIRKFRLDKKIRYIRFDKENRSIFKDFNLYLQPKLMLRRIGHELIAVYDPNQHFCVCDVYIIILNSDRVDSDLFYLEALLNSSLMSFYLMQHFTSVKRIFPKIPISYLKDLPIKIPSNFLKIQKMVKNLHTLPWNIKEANSHQLKLLDDYNQEIFRIYNIDKHEQNIIYHSYHQWKQ